MTVPIQCGPDETFVLNLGPQHPATHGVLRVKLVMDGEYVVQAEPVLGYIHRMHEKIWQKLVPLCQKDELIKVFGREESDKGIITWGSSAQVVLETVTNLGLQHQVKVCIPELICPLPGKMEAFVKSIKKLLVVEMNYSGQLHRYLRSQVNLPSETRVYARAGGRPLSRTELTEPITEVAR